MKTNITPETQNSKLPPSAVLPRTGETRNSELREPPRHRMISNAATRLHRRRGLSRHWLAQPGPRPVPGRSMPERTGTSESSHRPELGTQPMKRACILFFVYFVYFVVSLPASTITGNLQNTSGNAYATNALFAPLSTPLASGNSLIASTPTNVVAGADGSFSVVLKQGDYLVTIGGLRRDSFLISVPNDANTYNMNSLITSVMTFNYPYSPTYEQRLNKGQAGGYVGLVGTVLDPSGLTASNLNLVGSVNLGVAANNFATIYVNQNSGLYVQPGGGFILSGDSSPRAEMFLHGTNAFVRFDEDAGINDSTSTRVWKFNHFNVTRDNVATLGDATNIVNSLGTVPIGGIVAWDKSLTGMPALPGNFVECNGQTINDPASPLNGRTVRNLNGNNQFIRGNSASGTMGGAASHTHSLPAYTTTVGTGAPNDQYTVLSGTTSGSAGTLPPYTDMVWVMRIK